MKQSLNRLRDFAACARALGRTPREQWHLFWCQLKNLRVRLGLAEHAPDRVYALGTVYGTLHFRDNFGDITNLLGLYYHQVYRPHRLQTDGAIVDVGANIGLAAALFAHHNPDRPIYCFEPLGQNVEMVRRNCPRAVVEQIALGATASTVALQVDEDSVMASAIPCGWETHEETFEVNTLDQYTEERGIGAVALLKIDTEGMELDILRGGQETLRRVSEVVMETHGTERHAESMRLLRVAGLEVDSEEFDGETGFVRASRPVGEVAPVESVV